MPAPSYNIEISNLPQGVIVKKLGVIQGDLYLDGEGNVRRSSSNSFSLVKVVIDDYHTVEETGPNGLVKVVKKKQPKTKIVFDSPTGYFEVKAVIYEDNYGYDKYVHDFEYEHFEE